MEMHFYTETISFAWNLIKIYTKTVFFIHGHHHMLLTINNLKNIYAYNIYTIPSSNKFNLCLAYKLKLQQSNKPYIPITINHEKSPKVEDSIHNAQRSLFHP